MKRRSARKASIEHPLCSHASMSVAASASSSPARRNHRMSRFRIRAVRVSRSPGVVGRAGRKVTAPMRGNSLAALSDVGATPAASRTSRSTSLMKIRAKARANPKLRMPQRR